MVPFKNNVYLRTTNISITNANSYQENNFVTLYLIQVFRNRYDILIDTIRLSLQSVSPDPNTVDARFILTVDPYAICNCVFFGFILLLSVVYTF